MNAARLWFCGCLQIKRVSATIPSSARASGITPQSAPDRIYVEHAVDSTLAIHTRAAERRYMFVHIK